MSYYTARCTYCGLEVGAQAPRVLVAALEPLCVAMDAPSGDGHAHTFELLEETGGTVVPLEFDALRSMADVDARIAAAFARQDTAEGKDGGRRDERTDRQ
jgi:hypothetical protein